MIQISRTKLLNQLALVSPDIERGSRRFIEENAVAGNGEIAMAFLVKRGYLSFSKEEIVHELDNMAELSLISFEQLDQMKALLENASNGSQRVLQYLRKKRRIEVV